MTPVQQIKDKNDFLRRLIHNIPPPHTLVITKAVTARPHEKVLAILEKVKNFKSFTPENDPYGEHDSGEVLADGERFFWKIDYYDETYEFYKEDGIRVFTIMEASEW